MNPLNTTTFHANGKLLISGEYFVLDGALSLAVPVNKGQSLHIFPGTKNVQWRSFDEIGACWFEAIFSLPTLEVLSTSNEKMALTLSQILQNAQSKNKFINQPYRIETHLEFPRLWGFGSSSTLIHCLAEWASIDAFQLLWDTMGGSGYDIACAGAKGSILYQKENNKVNIEACHFSPSFKESLYFIYLGKKQNSRAGIKQYRNLVGKDRGLVATISELTKSILSSDNKHEFQSLMKEHEDLISGALQMEKVKDLYFKDFQGAVKSLGAWGGDFVLACSDLDEKETRQFFEQKGFDVILNYKNLVLEHL